MYYFVITYFGILMSLSKTVTVKQQKFQRTIQTDHNEDHRITAATTTLCIREGINCKEYLLMPAVDLM